LDHACCYGETNRPLGQEIELSSRKFLLRCHWLPPLFAPRMSYRANFGMLRLSGVRAPMAGVAQSPKIALMMQARSLVAFSFDRVKVMDLQAERLDSQLPVLYGLVISGQSTLDEGSIVGPGYVIGRLAALGTAMAISHQCLTAREVPEVVDAVGFGAVLVAPPTRLVNASVLGSRQLLATPLTVSLTPGSRRYETTLPQECCHCQSSFRSLRTRIPEKDMYL
jgi:hypothetical protein